MRLEQRRGTPGRALLGSPEASAWLTQFSDFERGDAEALLESLTLVSGGQFEEFIRSRVEEVANSAGDRAVAAYCVRDVEKDEHKVPDRYFGDGVLERVRKDEPGSDWRCAHILKRLAGGIGNLFEHPTIEELSEIRPSTVLLIDDISTSGTNLGNFLYSFHSDPLLWSLYSAGCIRYEIVIHTLGINAVQGMRDRFAAYGGSQFLRKPPRITSSRTDMLIDGRRFRALLYDNRSRLPKVDKCRQRWNGFRGTMASTVFSHGCPNNVPSALWSPGPGLLGLFPGRSVPSKLLARFERRIGPDSSSGPGAALERSHGPLELRVVEALYRGRRTDRALYSYCGAERDKLAEVLELLGEKGIATADRRLTAEGLKAARLLSQKPSLESVDRNVSGFYYLRPGGQ